MIDAPPEENVGAGPAVVLAALLTCFFNHRWTQINTDIGICIRVYLCPFAVQNSVINDAHITW